MIKPYTVPTAYEVVETLKQFEIENEVTENALRKLFSTYPNNTDVCHILWKVLAINQIYYTNLYAVQTIAEHIRALEPQLDAALLAGDTTIVDKMRRVLMPNGKTRDCYSFTTKYCSWHNPVTFPIYDKVVAAYLWAVKDKLQLSCERYDALRNYALFIKVIGEFQKQAGLGQFSIRQIDQYIWYTYRPRREQK